MLWVILWKKRGTREVTDACWTAEVSVCSQQGCLLISPHSWKCHNATERCMPTEKPQHRKIPAFSRSKVTKVAAQTDISTGRTHTRCSRVSLTCATGTKEAKTHSRAAFFNPSKIKRGNTHMLKPSHPSHSASWKHRWKPGLNWFQSFNEDKFVWTAARTANMQQGI